MASTPPTPGGLFARLAALGIPATADPPPPAFTVARVAPRPISCAVLTAAGTRPALSISTRLSPARAPPEHGAAAVAAALVIAACCRHVLAGIPPGEKKTPMANEPLIGGAGPGTVGTAAP